MLGELYIVGCESISSLGQGHAAAQSAYMKNTSAIKWVDFSSGCFAVAPVAASDSEILAQLGDARFAGLDRSVLLALVAAKELTLKLGWQGRDDVAINIGSSRGATAVWERAHQQFLETGKVPVLTSPLSTLGNISSWVAQSCALAAPAFSHSVTCTTALHAIANGAAWLAAGFTERMIVGASEAPLTDFTLAQMRALRLYTKAARSDPYPCRPLALDEKSSSGLVLGEGAVLFGLQSSAQGTRPLARVIGIGAACEAIESATAISENGQALGKAMSFALQQAQRVDQAPVDLVIMHAPGNRRGDLAELAAVKACFAGKVPAITSNKWKVGHTFGAAGALSLEYALTLLNGVEVLAPPYRCIPEVQAYRATPRKIMINAAGFGGNAVSVVISAV